MDAFLCVHRRDLDYLFPAALTSLAANLAGLDGLHVVSNEPEPVAEAVQALLPGRSVAISADGDWLSRAEAELPGWYRQQLIKLRAYEFCATPAIMCLGADTLLLRRVEAGELVQVGEPVLRYTRHRFPDQHWWYERGRVQHIAALLGVLPLRAARYVDFINDCFTFDAETLRALQRYLARRYGPDPYDSLLRGLGTSSRDQRRFGEWTLYATYLLDVERRTPPMAESSGFVHQIHSRGALHRFGWDTAAVHLVPKDLDAAAIAALAGVRAPAPRP